MQGVRGPVPLFIVNAIFLLARYCVAKEVYAGRVLANTEKKYVT